MLGGQNSYAKDLATWHGRAKAVVQVIRLLDSIDLLENVESSDALPGQRVKICLGALQGPKRQYAATIRKQAYLPLLIGSQ
jgi:hypothetical protein